MIKAIIFDLWYTLGAKKTSPSSTFFSHFGIKKDETAIKKMEYAVQIQDITSYEHLAKNLLEKFGQPDTKENISYLSQVYKDAIEGAKMYEGMDVLLTSLHGKYKLGLLSNSHELESHVIRKWELDHYFDEIIFSWGIKALKPDIKAFEVMSYRLGVPFEEILLIDDTEMNVEAAEAYGMKAIRFEGLKELQNKLKDLNIVVKIS